MRAGTAAKLATATGLALAGGWVASRTGVPALRGVKAYVFGLPMIMMDLTKEAATASIRGEITAPINQFASMTTYPDASFRAVARTGLDTLFATAWVDLDEEPLVLSVPDTGGRYYVIALFDMWSNVFASIGKRTTGTKAGSYLIAGPGWQGAPPADVAKTYRSPTRFVWVNGQMRADGPEECELVNSLQEEYSLTPLSAWGTEWNPPSDVPVPLGTDATPPIERVATMDAGAFFGRLASLMGDNPPTPADSKRVKTLASLGIVPGTDFDLDAAEPQTVRGLQRAMATFGLMMKLVQKLKTANGWIVIPDNFANYGTDYKTRAGISLLGLGGIWRQDIMYPTAFMDGDKNALDGEYQYVLHFDSGQTPPCNEFWSVSMYDPDGYYVPNAMDRYSIASWMPLAYGADGSLDIFIQTDSPGEDKESNWLPAPAAGSFSLTTRIFWPKDAVLDRRYSVPPVKRVFQSDSTADTSATREGTRR